MRSQVPLMRYSAAALVPDPPHAHCCTEFVLCQARRMMKQHANSNVETVSAVVAFNPKTGISAADVDVVTVTFGDMPDVDIERAIDSGKGDVRETPHSVAPCAC